jgi:hypothetical protein
MKIYVVLYSEGEYSDREVFAEKAFTSEAAAQNYIKSEEARIRKGQLERGMQEYEIPHWIAEIELTEE